MLSPPLIVLFERDDDWWCTCLQGDLCTNQNGSVDISQFELEEGVRPLLVHPCEQYLLEFGVRSTSLDVELTRLRIVHEEFSTPYVSSVINVSYMSLGQLFWAGSNTNSLMLFPERVPELYWSGFTIKTCYYNDPDQEQRKSFKWRALPGCSSYSEGRECHYICSQLLAALSLVYTLWALSSLLSLLA